LNAGLNFSPVAKFHTAPSAAMCASANRNSINSNTPTQLTENRLSKRRRTVAIRRQKTA
jgi:hypothetical protein